MRCYECGGELKKTKGTHHYRESGLDNIYLKNIPINKCKKCGEYEIEIKNTEELHILISFALMLKPDALIAKEARFFRKLLGYTEEQMANALGIKRVTVSRYETSDKPLNLERDKHLRRFFLEKKGKKFVKHPFIRSVISTTIEKMPSKERRIEFDPEDWAVPA